ncbi:hypothetical protein [Prevotella sp.]|jgi:hypothetical protein|uniref:hypothetical protein n=1 Tax=Prevotella sp. TaxID=59823 RepID=UPI0020679013|nr:MAG TPA_asm: hypothetical protein [Caudoviricetes sp.]
MIRKGCIYIEEQRNLGKGREQNGRGTSGRLVRGVGFVGQTRRRWVCEFSYHRKRIRFRSTCFGNVVAWRLMMQHRLSD